MVRNPCLRLAPTLSSGRYASSLSGLGVLPPGSVDGPGVLESRRDRLLRFTLRLGGYLAAPFDAPPSPGRSATALAAATRVGSGGCSTPTWLAAFSLRANANDGISWWLAFAWLFCFFLGASAVKPRSHRARGRSQAGGPPAWTPAPLRKHGIHHGSFDYDRTALAHGLFNSLSRHFYRIFTSLAKRT